MQKICVIILLSALASNHEAVPQTKWSRLVRTPLAQVTRERRQFPFGEWIPLSQPCPTCRLFADPLEAGLRAESIGLTPPKPPTVTRQIHGEGNFFPQDESSILSVPPPPPSSIPGHPIPNGNGNFQFSTFGQSTFNAPLPVPTQKIFPQAPQVQFLPQTFLSNQPLLVNGNQQIVSGFNAQSNLFGHEQRQQQQANNGKVAGFNSEFKSQKIPENVVLEQNKRPVVPNQVFSKPQPFTHQQQNQQTFVKQQTFNGGQQQTFNGQQQKFNGQQHQAFGNQQQHSVNFENSILTPPPAPKNVSQDIVIPGLDKEEIQLLYVPVETLRQRGTPQEQLLTQQPQNIQFFNRQNGLQRPVNNAQPTEQTIITQGKGHFITQKGNQGNADNSQKITSAQPFPTTVTPSTILLQHLPFQQTPQPFVSATPSTPNVSPFVTPSPSVFQKFSPFTPETTLSHLSTVPNTIQFTQSDIEFGTTPKTVTSQGVFSEEIINGKPQFSGLKSSVLTQDGVFSGQQQAVTQQPQLSTVFSQEPLKEVVTPTHFPQQIDQQQLAFQKQQQRQKELEEQRFLEQQRKQKELEEQRLLQQQQRQKELEQQRFIQKQKELEEQRLQQQQRQKELEQQRFLQKQKELEEQRQKELEQQRFLQKQKELEEQRLLQQRRQKELEQQRFLQKQKELEEQRLLQQRQKELEEQRFLQEQRQKELENQRRLQLERQKELEEKRRLQQKQKEEEARLLRFQQQQRELEQQRLLQQKQQQEEQQRILQQQKLQKQENLKKQQQFQFLEQQQQQQQQKQAFPQQGNRHVLPANDNLNLIPQLEKESAAEDQQLVPHQPPLSVFFKGRNGEAKITDVLRELRRSNTIIVLDQYFEKMPTVFVGPAGLIPPTGYGKFDLPYLSNIESNRIERRIDKLPFFVAPLNFIPPPGYAKIPFPAPHVGSVVVSSESNPAMKLEANGKGPAVEENSGSFPVVGPELPGLINSLDTITTTIKPTTYTPSLPQTTAQLRNRRPSNSVYKPQSRKPISRTRPTTTSKPEEEVTQPIQKVEATKEPEVGFRKPFNRFFSRRRQQAKTTTEAPVKSQQDRKSLENRHYSIDLLNQEKNQVQRTQQKSDVVRERPTADQFNGQFEHSSSNIDRITPGGQEVFEARPTPDLSRTSEIESEERHPDISEYVDVNLHSFEDGPLPTGSAKTITQEVYRPNAIAAAEAEENSKSLSKPDSTQSSVQFQASVYEDVTPTKFSEISDPTPTDGLVGYKDISSEGQVGVEPTSITGYEKQEVSSERFDTTDSSREKASYAPESGSGEQHVKGFINSGEQYTSAFAEISKPHHIPGFVDPSRRQNSNVYTSQEISVDLEAPFPQNQQAQQYDVSGEVRPTNSAQASGNKFAVTGSSNEEYLTVPEGVAKAQQSLDASTSHVSPTAPGATEGQYTTGFSVNSQGTLEGNRQYEDQRIGSFISVQDVQGTISPQEYYSSSPAFPSPASATDNEYPAVAEKSQSHLPPTPETVAEVTANPSAETYTSAPEGSVNVSEQTTEGHGQEVANNLANDHRLKLPNPSIVRVRTRVRGKSRGQVNFAASQTTTQAPFIRSTVENRHIENTEQESTTKTTHFREYNPVKISKYNQFRGVKKPVRTTTEAAVEYEQKANVYTVRPHRRPLNPSTVSTKRIRRPTTPIPSVEPETEAFGISTLGSHSQSDISDISPSGVSNDVYYEQSSLSPVKHKFRKHFGQAEQKNDVVPAYVSTSHPSVAPTYSTFAHDAYTGESQAAKDLTHAEGASENSDKYPEWNPSDSGFDVSGIVLTTVRTPGQEEQQQQEVEPEEPKKSQDSKKAFDPDLEKKTGRRRVRVRVHKRPHENFETAESQNLRTVANVLVPPTTTYKPNDESSFHQLAKNADFSFGGQKLFGLRSREYFRKRLNLTQIDDVLSGKGEQAGESTSATSEAAEKPTGPKMSAFLRKAQKNEFESSQANETAEVGKAVRPKFRGFVRKIVKHTGVNKETDPEAKQLTENEEEKHENDEVHSRQTFRVNQGFNHTGRVNGTRHKTFVRFVKKNKIRHQEPEAHEESTSEEAQKEEQVLHQTTESHTEGPQQTESETTEVVKEEKKVESQFPAYHSTEETTQNIEPQQEITRETTEEAEAKQQVSTETTPTESGEAYESSSPVFQELSTAQPPTPLTQLTGLYLTQRPKFYQTLRPVFQRTIGFQRTKEPVSTTSTTEHSVQESHEKTSRTQETQEKRTGYTRYKYGKTTGYGSSGFASTANEKSDETKKLNEQQLKNKNLHTLEVRKYLRTKTREGAFSQFSKNKYFTSEKTETVPTTKDQDNGPEEETTTQRIAETSPIEPKTTEAVVAHTYSTEVENETTQKGEETEPEAPTTEAVSSLEEETSEEEEEEEEEVSRSATLETTTETEIPTTVYQASTSRATEVTEPKTTIPTTESVEPQRTEYEPDIYRFSKHSFSFDEAAQFTGTKNRAHVRNITTDIIENTASFSAPGVEKRPEIRVVTHRSDEVFTDSTQKEKTETTTTELNGLETTTEYPETTETGTSTSAAEAATKAKVAKVLKTSTTTKISHETEICYRGKCIRTKSENPDEDLKLLVDSASTMKIEKTKRGT